jgi:predicted SnoaL-like aldol condensation-catalyzing enzyme
MSSADLKGIATRVLHECAAGRAREAFRAHAAEGFRHHNPHFAGDAESLAAAMEANARQFPQKALQVKRAIQEGATVVLHSFVKHTAEEPGYALVHIFRFDGERIAELWDIAQEVPAESPNEHGMF